MFSAFIVWYLFFAGTGSGVFIITILSSLQIESNDPRLEGRLRISNATGLSAAAFCMMIASLFLLSDFGDPWIIWRVVLTPFSSWASFGACVVAVFTAITVSLAVASIIMVNIPRWLLWSARSIGILLALTTMVYAGLLLISMIAIDVWSTWLLPLLFVVSSLSCGLAATLFMEPYFSGPKSKTEPTFWRIQPLLGVLEFVVLITFIGERMGFSQTAQGSIESLILGNYAVAFWLGVVLLGLLMPLLIHILYRKIPIKALVQVSSVGVLTGGFFLRFCVVGIGLYAPLFPGS